MSDIDTIVKTLLIGDATLMAMLPGGIHTARVDKISTPTAYDAGGELMQCIRIRLEVETPTGFPSELPLAQQPIQVRTPMAVYFLRQRDQDALRPAMARTMTLLQGARLAGAYACTWAESVTEQTEDTLKVAQSMQRYYITRILS